MGESAKVRLELETLPDGLDGYDEIYLGYPNYWGDLPMAVYTFPKNCDWTGKTIHPFCTHESSGLSGTEQKIALAAKGARMLRWGWCAWAFLMPTAPVDQKEAIKTMRAAAEIYAEASRRPFGGRRCGLARIGR